MEKIIVIGCPGSGKSTFSKALHAVTGIPLYHLDRMYWNADQTTVERPVFLKRLEDTMEKNRWIIDGNYASTMELRMNACDTVIFLDYPPEICLAGVRQRRGIKRSDLPWVETEEDEAFMAYIQDFNTQQRPKVMQLLEKYAHKKIYIFTCRREAEDFLENIPV